MKKNNFFLKDTSRKYISSVAMYSSEKDEWSVGIQPDGELAKVDRDCANRYARLLIDILKYFCNSDAG